MKKFTIPTLPIAAAAISLAAAPLHAQTINPREDAWSAPRWMGDAAFLGLNALSSGVSAGLLQLVRGKSFTDAFARGALGGSIHYAGMRLSAERFDGAGLLGRQVSAAGVSMVRNASDGRPALERLFVPLGPLNLYVDLSNGVAVRPKINVAALTVLVSAAAESELDWDAGATLSAGAPVFRAYDRALLRDGDIVNGYFFWGSVFVSNVAATDLPRVLAHERVHVLQSDWMFLTWSDPAEAWVLNRLPLGPAVHRYVDIGVTGAILHHGLYELFNVSHSNQLHEIEAHFLGGR